MKPHFRIALGSLFTECNHFSGALMTLEDFRRSELRCGSELLSQRTGTVGGMLAGLASDDVEVLPLLLASACPGGALSSSCYNHLKNGLLERLESCGDVDGVLLALHGAATVEDVGDLEGDLLEAVRWLVGPAVPIVATLDLHAHMTDAMVRNATALIAWKTYPHRDAFETGERGATLLCETLAGRIKPVMAFAKVPVIVGALNAQTEPPGPFADVVQFANSHEGQGRVLSTSVFLVHPYLDLPDMGGGGLVITDDDPVEAQHLAEEIAMRYWDRRFNLEPALFHPAEAVERGRKSPPGPVLLVETADCCGGGAAGDSVASLAALLAATPAESALVPVVDPEAAERCHRQGAGATVTLRLGHRVDSRWGTPLDVSGEVLQLSDGDFMYSGGIWDGQPGRMGPTAVFRIGEVQVVITSYPTYDWNGEQFQSLGLDASGFRFVVVKNPMNYRMAYGSIASEVFILDTPGPTPATVRHLTFQRLQRPYYPADAEIPSLRPCVSVHAE